MLRWRPFGARALAAILLAATLVAGCASATPGRLTFSPNDLKDGTVGQRYEEVITIRGNDTPVFRYSVQNGLLPPGLSIEAVPGSDNTGRIVGIPLVAGTAQFEVVVLCKGTSASGQTGTQSYTLTIKA